jgi:putative tryptophan/tyrosine transport system substrate-binding protein
LAVQHRIAAVFTSRQYAQAGGLMTYGASVADSFRQAAAYVDRILKGEKPADLPVQAPTNVRTRYQPEDCQGPRPHHSMPLIGRADEVIE